VTEDRRGWWRVTTSSRARGSGRNRSITARIVGSEMSAGTASRWRRAAAEGRRIAAPRAAVRPRRAAGAARRVRWAGSSGVRTAGAGSQRSGGAGPLRSKRRWSARDRARRLRSGAAKIGARRSGRVGSVSRDRWPRPRRAEIRRGQAAPCARSRVRSAVRRPATRAEMRAWWRSASSGLGSAARASARASGSGESTPSRPWPVARWSAVMSRMSPSGRANPGLAIQRAGAVCSDRSAVVRRSRGTESRGVRRDR
jgi:hypothetical protein